MKLTYGHAGRSLVLVAVATLAAGCSQLQPGYNRNAADAVTVQAGSLVLPSYLSREVIERAIGPRADLDAAMDLLAEEEHICRCTISKGNRATLLVDGPATFEALHGLVDRAAKEVLVEFFIFADDQVGRRFAKGLKDATSRGVEVRVIFDAIGSIGTDSTFFDDLRESGISVRAHNPPVDPQLSRLNNRNHRKLVVVDNRVVVLGGINVTSAYESSSSTNPGPERGITEAWRDTSIQIDGPVAASYRALFDRDWQEVGGEPLPEMDSPRARGNLLIRPLYSDGGDNHEFNAYHTYLNVIRHASERIWLTHAYFSPDDVLIEALVAAAARGVDVRLVLPGFIDFDVVYHASRSNYDRLLRNGVRIFERSDALLHSKTAVIDGYWSTIGSANLDMRSFVHNDEVNAIVIGRSFAVHMEDLFRRDAGKSDEITLEAWRERGLLTRVQEFFARRVNYFL